MRYCVCFLFVLSLLFGVSGCGSVTPVYHEGNNPQNYKDIFKETLPSDVEVVHSVYVTYSPSFRPGVITTPDWEVEVIAPESWITGKAKKLYLRKIEDVNDFPIRMIKDRVEQRGREWYVPKDISEYTCYYLYPTSIPYVHMLVDKTPVSNGRYRVFLSKH